MWGSAIILMLFLAGGLIGYFGVIDYAVIPDGLSFAVLGAMIFLIGMSLGLDRNIGRTLRGIRWDILLYPIATVAGTLVFAAIASLFLPRLGLAESLAVDSAVGYYSLASVLIVDVRSAVDPSGAVALGTVALMANILRELITLVGAPLIVRYFGRRSLVSCGGVTAIDVTLPVIRRYAGEDMVPLAVVSGILLEIAVPLMVVTFALM